MKRIVTSLAMLSIVALMFTSCQKPPEKEMTDATQAVSDAKAAEANRYVADQFNALSDSLKVATEGVEAQKSKFILFRNFEKPKAQLVSVITLAGTVKANAEKKKEEVKAEAQKLIDSAKTVLTATKELLANAPKGKEGEMVLTDFQNNLTVIEGAINEASTLFTSNDFLGAKDKVAPTFENLNKINGELKEAIEKFAKAQPKKGGKGGAKKAKK